MKKKIPRLSFQRLGDAHLKLTNFLKVELREKKLKEIPFFLFIVSTYFSKKNCLAGASSRSVCLQFSVECVLSCLAAPYLLHKALELNRSYCAFTIVTAIEFCVSVFPLTLKLRFSSF